MIRAGVALTLCLLFSSVLCADPVCPFARLRDFRRLSYAFPGLYGPEGTLPLRTEQNNQLAQMAVDILKASGVNAELHQDGNVYSVRIVPERVSGKDPDVVASLPLNLVAELVERKIKQKKAMVIFSPFAVGREYEENERNAAEVFTFDKEKHLRLPYAAIDSGGKLEHFTIHELVHILQDAKAEAGDFNLYHGEVRPLDGGEIPLGGNLKGSVYAKQGFRFDELLARVRELQFVTSQMKLLARAIKVPPLKPIEQWTPADREANALYRNQLALLEKHLGTLGWISADLKSLASATREQARAMRRSWRAEREITKFQINGKWFAKVVQTSSRNRVEMTVPLANEHADAGAAFQARVGELEALAARYETAAGQLNSATETKGEHLEPWRDRVERCTTQISGLNDLLRRP